MSERNTRYDRRTMMKLLGGVGAAGLAGCVGTGGRTETPTSSGSGSGSESSGSSDGTDTATEASEPSMAGSIEAWSWDVAARSLDLVDDSYEEANGGDVSIRQIGRADMKDKYRSTLLSGTGAPAVATMESVDAAAWVDTGGLRDISEWIQESGVRDGFVEGKWGPLSKDGATYALPWDIGPVGTFYRRDVYDEYDIDPDSIETWDQFIEEGRKLPDDQYLLNIPSNDYDGLWRMLYRMLGGQPFTEDGAVDIDNEKSLMVARTLKQARDAGVADNKASWSSSWFSAFGSGSVASLNGGAWMEGTLRAELPDTSGMWGVMKPPAFESGGARATNWGGSNLVIADQVSDEKARRGFDFMQYALASEEMQLRMYSEFGIFPAYEPAYQSDEFDTENDFFDGQRSGRLFAELATEIPPYRYTVDTPEVTKAINSHFRTMMQGDITPQEAIRTVESQVAERTGREQA